METILEENEEHNKGRFGAKLIQLWSRFHQSTFPINDCASIIHFVLIVILLSYSSLSDNLLNMFHTISHDSQSIAAAYTQILTDLQHAFLIVGGLLADCVYGRVPLLIFSLMTYSICILLSLACITLFKPAFYILFILVLLSSFSYGIVMCTAITLLCNYHYLQSPFRSQNVQSALLKFIIATSLSTIFIRCIMFYFPFLTGLQILSSVSAILLSVTCMLLYASRNQLISIPLHGNPVKEYTHTYRVLSNEYNYSVIKPRQNITKGNQILMQASSDYYSRSVSRESLDGTPSILRSSSLDCYYITQEVNVPHESLGNEKVVIKVLTPLKNGLLLQREEEEKNRETAVLFQNGVRTNLIGQMVRMCRICMIVLMQCGIWCCFEYTQSVIQSEFHIISQITSPSSFLLFVFELFDPSISFLIALVLSVLARILKFSTQYKVSALQWIGLGVGSLSATLVVTFVINIMIYSSHHPSSVVLLFAMSFLSCTEILLTTGSLLFYYQEAPRRAQAIFISLYFVSRYGGSLLFYCSLPLLNMLRTDSSPHDGFPMLITFGIVVALLVCHCTFSEQYCYVTEKELDMECEVLTADRILHPLLVRYDPFKKHRSKSCESVPSSKSSLTERSMSDEVILMNSVSRSISTAFSLIC